MNKLIKKIITASLTLTLVMGAFAFSYADESSTIEVKGYRDDWHSEMTDEEISNAISHFSVSNVIKKMDKKDIPDTSYNVDEALVVSVNSKVELLAKDGVQFSVVKLVKDKDGKFDYYSNENKEMELDGKVKIWDVDKTGALDEYGSPKFVEVTIEASDLNKYDVVFPIYQPGVKAVLSEEGYYFVNFRYEARAGEASAFLEVRVEDQTSTEESNNLSIDKNDISKPVKALPTNSNITVDGVQKSLEAYNIDGNNYFKLRDLAMLANGSQKQFEVEWDSQKKAINLISEKAYTALGSEMNVGDGKIKYGVKNTSPVYKDSNKLELLAYTINDNNYFKLRDIADAFDISVMWDESTKTILIETK